MLSRIEKYEDLYNVVICNIGTFWGILSRNGRSDLKLEVPGY